MAFKMESGVEGSAWRPFLGNGIDLTAAIIEDLAGQFYTLDDVSEVHYGILRYLLTEVMLENGH